MILVNTTTRLMMSCFNRVKNCIFIEELSYDEVEVTRKDTGKRKAALHDTSTSSKKSRTSVASSRGSKVSTGSVKSNNSKNKTQMVQKHHYPSSLCDPSVELLEHMRQGSHHRQIFTKLVDEIVESERNTIQAYALSENAKSLKGRKHIFETLDSVMETWASEVHNLCPESVVFEPEISKAERSELKPLHETKLALEKHSQKLGQFENDFKRLAQEYDIWLGSEIVMSKLEHAATLVSFATALIIKL